VSKRGKSKRPKKRENRGSTKEKAKPDSEHGGAVSRITNLESPNQVTRKAQKKEEKKHGKHDEGGKEVNN